MKLILMLICLPLATTLSAEKVELEEHVHHSFRSELILSRVPMARAVTLRKEFKAPKTAAKAYERLVGWAEKGEAEIVEWPTVTSFPSEDVGFGNFQTVRRPIQYERSKTGPNEAKVQKAEANNPDDAPAIVSAAGDQLFPSKAKPTTWNEAGSVSFQDTEVGLRFGARVHFQRVLEGDEYRDNLALLNVRLYVSRKSLLGYRKERFEMESGFEGMVEQPRFDTQELTTELLAQDGVPQMVGFFKMNEPKNVVEIWVFSATVLETKYKAPKSSMILMPLEPATPPPPPVEPPRLIPGAEGLQAVPGVAPVPVPSAKE